MKTLRLLVDPAQLDAEPSRRAIAEAAGILRRGGLVALPTETVYGLGANALDAAAVARIFAAKQRPPWDPVIVHVAAASPSSPMIEACVAEIPERARALIAAFWPGPLTLLLPRSAAVPDTVTAGRPLVGVRMPSHPVAFELIRQAGVPVAAPSANVFGHISPTSADHVLEDLDGRIDAVLDAGSSQHGVESTVLDPEQMMIYRPGAITAAQIEKVAGAVQLYAPELHDHAPLEALPSPGVGIRHYAPRAHLQLIEAPLDKLPARIAAALAHHPSERVGVMLPAELQETGIAPDVIAYPWGRWAAPNELARNLYAGLRALDARGCTLILCPLPSAEGVGAAMRDRLLKAARADSR
ncbi:MAG TPA: L-threonylcarbamoyladenylate synthase [Terracidiphilus sp.]|nr:L-threonylcarbamoyladenylate synthase [Terracidiphilus sp.]